MPWFKSSWSFWIFENITSRETAILVATDVEWCKVRCCTICATTKPHPGQPFGLLQSVANPNMPWEEITMDFIVDLPSSNGNTVIWTIVDLFSKQAHFVPCPGLPSAWKLSKMFIQHIYRLHGVSCCIILDRGVQFTAKFCCHFLTLIGSSQGLSTAYHLNTNGTVEWVNTMVEWYIQCYVSYQQTDWADLLPFPEVAYSNMIHRSTGETPFKLWLVRTLMLFLN